MGTDPSDVAETRTQREVLEPDEGANYVDWSIPRQRHEAYAAAAVRGG